MDCSSGDYYFSFLLDEKRKKRIKKKRSFSPLLKFTFFFKRYGFWFSRPLPCSYSISIHTRAGSPFFRAGAQGILLKFWRIFYLLLLCIEMPKFSAERARVWISLFELKVLFSSILWSECFIMVFKILAVRVNKVVLEPGKVFWVLLILLELVVSDNLSDGCMLTLTIEGFGVFV